MKDYYVEIIRAPAFAGRQVRGLKKPAVKSLATNARMFYFFLRSPVFRLLFIFRLPDFTQSAPRKKRKECKSISLRSLRFTLRPLREKSPISIY